MVVSEMGEQWSPQTAPAMQAAVQLEKIRAAPKWELAFRNCVNSALVTTILDRIVG